MRRKKLVNLRIPGPIPVNDDILEAMGTPMINHRGPEFKEILYRTTDRLKTVFSTKNDVYIITGSGTSAMEAAVVNTLSPGDKACLLYTSPSPRDKRQSRMPSSA